jgi:hypothetical protein
VDTICKQIADVVHHVDKDGELWLPRLSQIQSDQLRKKTLGIHPTLAAFSRCHQALYNKSHQTTVPSDPHRKARRLCQVAGASFKIP